MIERPILFKDEMVRAILEGRKTQTRRLINPPPPGQLSYAKIFVEQFHPIVLDRGGNEVEGAEIFGAYDEYGEWGARCPYGKPGDHLWVREKFADVTGMGFDNGSSSHPMTTAYSADTMPGSDGDEARKDYGVKWKPSIHMKRSQSRISLEIMSVRVERLQEISERESICEGITEALNESGDSGWNISQRPLPEHQKGLYSAKNGFRFLWESINGARSWNANPWVWVIEFRKVDAK